MILEKITEATKQRIAKCKQKKALAQIKQEALALPTPKPFAFEQALQGPKISFICEIKKASPSKGIIADNFAYLKIASEYEIAGASAISVLTEPKFFLGNNQYLTTIKAKVNIPILRKDFIIDEYQIYESKCIGADAILLICTLLNAKILKKYITIADALGMSVLVEAHDEQEIKNALMAGARIIGINNRNLKNFTINMKNSLSLRHLVPNNIIFVSESGIKTANDIKILKNHNVNAVLIGETLMKCPDKILKISQLYDEKPPTKIKICGLSRLEDIAIVNKIKPNYIGFVFTPSRRQVTIETAEKLKNSLDSSIQSVGVFVNDNPERIANICNKNIINIIQLHGNESLEYIEKLKNITQKPIIKAVQVKSPADIEKYQNCVADYLLFDTYSPYGYGGTGKKFNWNYIKNNKKPFFLAGGLSYQNIARATYSLAPYCLDISSSVETNGIKDANKITEIINLVRRITL